MFDDGWDDFDAAATLDAAVEFDAEENRAALGKLQATLHFADLHTTLLLPHPVRATSPETSAETSGKTSGKTSRSTSTERGGERLVVYGGDGCPAIAEFAPAELGVLLKISSSSAATYIGEALALRHRLPRIWAKTLNGQTVVWRARAVARACLKLSAEAAALVDERVVAVIDTLSAYRLQKIIDAVIKEADPEAARKAAEERARERGVWVQPSDDHGTKTIWVKASSGDVITFDATINDLAWALHKLGDPDPLSERRAKAIGWLADPLAAYELLNAARYLATNQALTETPPSGTKQSPNGTTTTTAPGTPTTPHDLPDTEPRLLKATAPEPTDNSSDTKTTSAEAPPVESPGDPSEIELHPPGASSAESPCKPSENKLHPPGTSAATPTDESSGDDLRATQASAAERAAGSSEGEPGLPGVPAELPTSEWDEAEPDNEMERYAPHQSIGEELAGPLVSPTAETRAVIDPYSRHQLAGKLATIKKAAGGTWAGIGRAGRVVLYVHVTDHALLTGEGAVRVEEHGAFVAAQLKDLLGHDQVVLKPVIDLNEHLDVNAYEIPTRIRERVRLAQPVERFPYGTAETSPRTDLDHIQPYDPHGPPGQTSTANLTPATRFHHRVKTHGRGWRVQPAGEGALHWTTPNGFTFRVDHTGTHRLN